MVRRYTVQCPQHPRSVLIEDHHAGDLICPECGLVAAERIIDVGSEWRSFSNESGSVDNSRIGDKENPLLNSANLSTVIMPSKNSNFNDYSNSLRNKVTTSYEDRTMLYAFRQINIIADRLNLPKLIIDDSCHFFNKALTSKAVKRKNIDALVVGSIYIACRCEGVPRTLKELCAVSGISKVDIGRIFKKMKNVMNINISSVAPDSYIERFCSNMELPIEVIKLARKICIKVSEANLVTGRSPLSIAAVSISIAATILTQKAFNLRKIAEDCGVTESTIKSVYKSIKPHLSKIVGQELSGSITFINLDGYFS
ncbi:MAG: Transcription initiation factor IIB [Paramarteilia canceri]